jgi:penicillin-binding protein 1A
MDEAESRRATVISDMVDNDKLTQKEADFILADPIKATDKTAPTAPTAGLAPHFVEWVREQVVAELGEDALYGQGLRVVTTLDLDAQRAAEEAVADTITDPAGPQAALVALDEDGAIRAHVGGRSYDTLKVDLARGADGGGSGRQPGSTFKPFVLQAALEDGSTLADRYDGPAKIEVDVGGQKFPVENYGGSSFGNLTIADATKNSVNTVYAQLVAKVGPTAVADAAHAAGIDAELDEVPAIALGVEEVSPQDLASAYLTFANDGTRVEPYAISKIEDGDGNVVWEHEAKEPQNDAVDHEVVRAMTSALQGVVESGTGRAADIGRPVAGKTGTTQDNVDAWFAGFVPGYATVVWVGYPDPTPMDGVTGGGLPAQIWQKYMSVAMEDREVKDFPKPLDIFIQPRATSTTASPSTSSSSSTSSTATTEKPKKDNKPPPTTVPDATTTTEPPAETTTTAGGTQAEDPPP